MEGVDLGLDGDAVRLDDAWLKAAFAAWRTAPVDLAVPPLGPFCDLAMHDVRLETGLGTGAVLAWAPLFFGLVVAPEEVVVARVEWMRHVANLNQARPKARVQWACAQIHW